MRFILSFLLSTGFIFGGTIDAPEIETALIRTFAQQFKVPPDDIHISILHTIKPKFYTGSVTLTVTPTGTLLDVGYQTVWVEVRKKKLLLDRSLISIKVGLEMDVLITKVRIPRRQTISSDQLIVKHQLITDSYRQLVDPHEKIGDLVSSRVIPAGRILMKKYLREPPVVWKESPVRIQIIAGDLVLETSGISKKDGKLGEQIHVLCPSTGKRLTGIVKSPDLVVVELP
ncbi:MAG: flagellar basal body P-ring formation protein FlgA [FCB group bacterium]|nr:flagellar basal body P-ring formation protein FlgA [FCB group bacterium]